MSFEGVTWTHNGIHSGPDDDDALVSNALTSKLLRNEEKKVRSFGLCGICTSFLLGAIFMVVLEYGLFVGGIINVPDTSADIVQPECFGCVGMPQLCGAYSSVSDLIELGVEMEATTTVRYYPDGTTETIVDVQKDPLKMLHACDCSDVPASLDAVTCGISYVPSQCTNDCYDANGVDPDSIVMVYDPNLDKIYSDSDLILGNQRVKITSVFDRDRTQDPDGC